MYGISCVLLAAILLVAGAIGVIAYVRTHSVFFALLTAAAVVVIALIILGIIARRRSGYS